MTPEDLLKIEVMIEKRFEIYMHHMTSICVTLNSIEEKLCDIFGQLEPLPKNLLSSELESFELSARTIKTCKENGILTVKDLWFAPDKFINFLSKKRKKTFQEVHKFLGECRMGYYSIKFGQKYERSNFSKTPDSHNI